MKLTSKLPVGSPIPPSLASLLRFTFSFLLTGGGLFDIER